MKLTDCLAKILRKYKINHTFGLQGGAVVHIFDSLEKNRIGVTYTHHEQSAALAGVAYAKSTNHIGCVIVTTGPATTNAMTGLLAAWQDSVPCIFISGQSRSSHTSYGKKVRQVGTQEVNICDIVKPITKYSVFIKKKENFTYELEKAISIANSGRKGPVWIDIPLELQWSQIPLKKNKIIRDKKKYNFKLKKFTQMIRVSKKPLLVIGYGNRSLIDEKLFRSIVFENKIPFVTTWNACDFFPSDHPLNLGIIGMSGQRGANKSIFKSDLLICLGTHLSIPHTTTLYKTYAKNAKKIIVNIDKNQLLNLNLNFDLKIHADLNLFYKALNKTKLRFKNEWKNLSSIKKMNWYDPSKNNKINSNFAIREITKKIKNKCISIDGGGTALYAGFQSSIIYSRDRVICSSAISSMGTGLAETIGISKSKKFKKIICIIGDGSFLMNIQDLQSIKQDSINAVIFLINNNGYLAIRHTQKEFLKAKYYGTHPNWKLKMPNFKRIVNSFGIDHKLIKTKHDLNLNLKNIINRKSPLVCELMIDENQHSLFKQGYKKNNDGTFTPQNLSEMFPYFESFLANTNN